MAIEQKEDNEEEREEEKRAVRKRHWNKRIFRLKESARFQKNWIQNAHHQDSLVKLINFKNEKKNL